MKFSIRDILYWTLIAAICAGAYGYRKRLPNGNGLAAMYALVAVANFVQFARNKRVALLVVGILLLLLAILVVE